MGGGGWSVSWGSLKVELGRGMLHVLKCHLAKEGCKWTVTPNVCKEG